MTAMLQVLAAGVGNGQYQQDVERGLVEMIKFREEQEARQELDDDATSERQLRIVQHAILPYVERLQLLYRDELSSAQMCDLFQSLRPAARSSAHCLSHGNESVVVDIDDELNKQTIYIRCSDYNWSSPVERVDSCEPEMVKKTTLHAHYFSIALRLVEALEAETPLHRSRGVVCVGHGVGGAVGIAMGLILSGNSYNVKNVVSFGSPKVVVSTLAKVAGSIAPLRFVIAGDPLADVPVTDALGDGFQHIGEIFTLECPLTSKASPPSEAPAALREEPSPGESDVHGAAEVLMGMMAEPQEATVHVCNQPTAAPAAAARASKDTEMIDDGADDERWGEAEDSSDDADAAEHKAAENVAGARAAAGRDPYLFSVQHYASLLADTKVPISYGEGMEKWEDPSNSSP
jgi:pimeloyl-ACP methyl ester carboxylesterase